FDVSTDGKNDSTLDSAEQALRELAEGLEIEESTHKVLADANEDDDDDLLREDDGGLGDPMAEIELSMSAAELAELRSSTIPVQTVLVKLRKISFAIINSSTILLPAWRKLTTKHQLPKRLMPRDVRTRWNSTFTMLSFAVKYKAVIDDITDDRTMQL
ncbi:hypothetical protein BC629DRAFT_1260158, partial [Irpex lacteus]